MLKRDIAYVSGDLFSEVLVCSLYVPGTVQEKADQLMARILDMHDDFVRRADHPDGKENPKLVRSYYKQLRAELQQEIDAIAGEIGQLGKAAGE